MEKYYVKLQDIKQIAKKHAIKVSRLNKAELIRSIQSEEGNIACFATGQDETCNQQACLWRDDCVDAAKKQKKIA